MRICTFSGIFILATLFMGCGGKPRIEKLSETSVIVAFGDSLTSGVGAGKGKSYPSVLSESLGYPIINAGLSGENTSAGLLRLPSLLEEYQPDLVILCHGGNDFLQKQPNKVTESNLESMIRMIQDAGADVILVGVPTAGLSMRVPDLYEDLADEYHIPLDAEAFRSVIASAALTSDLVHPNEEGYSRVANALQALIRAAERE